MHVGQLGWLPDTQFAPQMSRAVTIGQLVSTAHGHLVPPVSLEPPQMAGIGAPSMAQVYPLPEQDKNPLQSISLPCNCVNNVVIEKR